MLAIQPGRDYAVVTGDVIDSSSLAADQRKLLPGELHRIGDELVALLGADRVSPLAVFGGDSWQVLVNAPADALKAALYVRASLLASRLDVDTRLAIGIGTVDFVGESIEESDGEAFRLSGRALKGLATEQRTMAFSHPDQRVSAPWDAVCLLLDTLIRSKWTAVRAREELGGASPRALAIVGSLRGWPASRSAAELWPHPVTPQAVGDNLNRAHWADIERVLKAYSSCLQNQA